MADDIGALRAAIAATGGAEEGDAGMLDAEGEVIGAASATSGLRGKGEWGDLVNALGDDEDETDLGPDGLPKLSLLLPKDVNNLPNPL